MMRAGTAWDIAEACIYLGGPAGAFVTGELLPWTGAASSGARPGRSKSRTISSKRHRAEADILRPEPPVQPISESETCPHSMLSTATASGIDCCRISAVRSATMSRSARCERYTVGFSWVTFGFIAKWNEGGELIERELILRVGPPNGIFAPYQRLAGISHAAQASPAAACRCRAPIGTATTARFWARRSSSANSSRATRRCRGRRTAGRRSTRRPAHESRRSVRRRARRVA